MLYAFRGAPDGIAPGDGLINIKGRLYGTTSWGGSKCLHGPPGGFPGCGTVYSISPRGVESVLYSFGGDEDGAQPNGSLIDVDGTCTAPRLWGAVRIALGRGMGCGTIYSISTYGKEKVLYRFASCSAQMEHNRMLDWSTSAAHSTARQSGVCRRSRQGNRFQHHTQRRRARYIRVSRSRGWVLPLGSDSLTASSTGRLKEGEIQTAGRCIA